MADQEIKEITSFTRKRVKPMTTVIGIKCIDGIVIASDSQASSEMRKDLETSKRQEVPVILECLSRS